MFGMVLGFLKNTKVLASIFAVIAVLGAGWYVLNLSEDNGELQEKLEEQKAANSQLESQMEENRQKYTTEIESLNASIERYMSSLSMATNTNEMLKKDLEEGAENDEELRKCLNKPLPDSAYKRLLQ